MARFATVAGISGVGFAALGIGVPLVMPDQLPEIVRWGLVTIGAALILAAWVWSMLDHSSQDGRASAQTTHGPASPAIGTIHGNPVFQYGPPSQVATQARKSPFGEPLSVVSAREYVERQPNGGPKTKADLPLAGVLVRIYKSLGPVPDDNLKKAKYWQRIDLTIADKVVDEELHTWGRMGLRALQPISLDDWQHGEFDHRRKVLKIPAAYSEGYEMSDLHFCKAEVDRIWLPPTASEANEESREFDEAASRARAAALIGILRRASKLKGEGQDLLRHMETAIVTDWASTGAQTDKFGMAVNTIRAEIRLPSDEGFWKPYTGKGLGYGGQNVEERLEMEMNSNCGYVKRGITMLEELERRLIASLEPDT